MKTLKIIHNIFTVVALIVAMYIGSGVEATRSEIFCSQAIFIAVVILLAIRFTREDRKEKNSL